MLTASLKPRQPRALTEEPTAFRFGIGRIIVESPRATGAVPFGFGSTCAVPRWIFLQPNSGSPAAPLGGAESKATARIAAAKSTAAEAASLTLAMAGSLGLDGGLAAEPSAQPAHPSISEDATGGVVPGRGHHATSGMGAGAAQIEPVHRRRVVGEVGGGAHEGHLVEALLALEDVAALKAEDPLEVGRRENLPLDDRVRDVGRVAGEVLHAGVAVAFPCVALPGLLVRRPVLGEHGHHPAPVVGEARIDRGRQLGFDIGLRGGAPQHAVLP